MAIINNTKKFIFIHVPKAAGTSVTNELAVFTRYCDIEIGGTAFGEKLQDMLKARFNLYKHITSIELQSIVESRVWNDYYKFSFVRNPYSRLFSTYNFLREWEGTSSELREKLLAFSSYNCFVGSQIWSTRPGPDNIFFPQGHWLKNQDRIVVDFVGKVEHIDRDLLKIVQNIDPYASLEKETVGVLNHSVKSLDDNLSKNSYKLVNKFYKQDFVDFAYEMKFE